MRGRRKTEDGKTGRRRKQKKGKLPVRADNFARFVDCVENELVLRAVDVLQCLLDHVITVRVDAELYA